MFYKQNERNDVISSVSKYDENIVLSFSFDPANSDYQQFKKNVAAGVLLEDPNGEIMTQEQVDAFLQTIP